jgi:cation diffusion facilitator CzcD-associated flavoprotein CzcO
MKVAIIGAGFAGLSSAKVLKLFGHEVTVFEKDSDVGGVWSASRRYPGVTTQNNKGTYHLSDFPMPRSYPEYPSGEQVQAYLASYADHFDVTPHLRLGTEVLSVDLDEQTGSWTVTTREVGTDERGAKFSSTSSLPTASSPKRSSHRLMAPPTTSARVAASVPARSFPGWRRHEVRT